MMRDITIKLFIEGRCCSIVEGWVNSKDDNVRLEDEFSVIGYTEGINLSQPITLQSVASDIINDAVKRGYGAKQYSLNIDIGEYMGWFTKW